MPGLPETRTHDLLDRINKLAAADRGNVLLLKTIERQAQQVINVNAAEGYMLLGALAAFRLDVDEMKASHERAIRAAPGQSYFVRNYAVSLAKTANFDAARAMARKAWHLEKATENLGLLVELNCEIGRFREAFQYVREASDESLSKIRTNVEQLEPLVRLVSEKQITDDAASQIARTALEMAPIISFKWVWGRVAQDDEDQWIDLAVCLEAGVGTVSRLNERLAEKLAEISENPAVSSALSSIVVRFTSSTDANRPN